MHVSVVVTQFLRELFFALIPLPYSPSLYDLCVSPVNTTFTPWCTVLALHPLCPSVFRPIECFLYEGLHLLVWLCPCDVSSLFGKGAMFLPRHYTVFWQARGILYTTHFCLSPSRSWHVRLISNNLMFGGAHKTAKDPHIGRQMIPGADHKWSPYWKVKDFD